MKNLIVLLIALSLAAAFAVLPGPGSEPVAAVEPLPVQTIMEAIILDDLPAHRIVFFGLDGNSLYISELDISVPVEDGCAVLEVADHVWYDSLENITDDLMAATLTPYLASPSGQVTPLQPVSYLIAIPRSPIVLETPDTMRSVVTSSVAIIRIQVRPGSTVTVNGQDCSDTVNPVTGEMSYNAVALPIGDNTFNIVVRSPYCLESALSLVLYREPQEIPLDAFTAPYGTVSQRFAQVIATTLPGASVEISTPYSDLDLSEIDTTGKFSFNAVFDHIGNNRIAFTASYPGKKPSEISYTVYYVPAADEYTKKAWALDARNYADLLTNILFLAEKSQVYEVKGVVQYQVSDKPQTVVINTSEDGKSQPVMLQNMTGRDWNVGEYYRIYADASATCNGMPLLVARYSYGK